MIRNLYCKKALLLMAVMCQHWLLVQPCGHGAWGRQVTFCEEVIPVSNAFVAQKLMNIIRQQMPYANMPQLRRDARRYFPMIEYCLRACGMPEDLKYIPIVESGFKNATSKAGAQGFWQLMEGTARGWGLQVTPYRDERNDIYKSTIAALRELASLYKSIRRDYGVSSWVLAAAAYNVGIGRIYSSMNRQGYDYFTMHLNPETAVYVYKIIAIKELFEYPELYLKSFQYNVFSSQPLTTAVQAGPEKEPSTAFQDLELHVHAGPSGGIEDNRIQQIGRPDSMVLKQEQRSQINRSTRLVGAQVVGIYPGFHDGDSITVELLEDLKTQNGFMRKGYRIRGKGWLIDARIHIDLGFSSDDVIVYDSDSRQGLALDRLNKNAQVILRVRD